MANTCVSILCLLARGEISCRHRGARQVPMGYVACTQSSPGIAACQSIGCCQLTVLAWVSDCAGIASHRPLCCIGPIAALPAEGVESPAAAALHLNPLADRALHSRAAFAAHLNCVNSQLHGTVRWAAREISVRFWWVIKRASLRR